jgi:homoserine O-acetyltransferase
MFYRHKISLQTQYYRHTRPFRLESGVELSQIQIAYRTWGTLNSRGDNAVLICHALTGWADADVWWQSLLGSGRALDPDHDFVVCSNVLGSCYGSTGPTSPNPKTGQLYGPFFPELTIRDIVQAQAVLLEALGIHQLQLVIGGSLGGMQVLEWALMYPDRVRAIAPIAVSGKHSAWCIGLSEVQRQAIYADPLWQGGNYSPEQPPAAGLSIARMIAMSTYRSWSNFEQRFGRNRHPTAPEQPFEIARYLQHQGQKLVERFDANTYITLTRAMDSHDVARGRGDYGSVLGRIHQPTLVVSIDSDVLYPPLEQEELAHFIPNVELARLPSLHGHDAFLIDMDDLNALVQSYRESCCELGLSA